MKAKDFIDYAEYELMSIKVILKTLLSSIFYLIFSVVFIFATRIPQLVFELVSFKGFSLAYIYFLVLRGANLESVLGLVGILGIGGYKAFKDVKSKNLQENTDYSKYEDSLSSNDLEEEK